VRFSSRARLPELIPVISRSHRDDRQEPLMGSLGVAQGLARGSVGGKVGAILRGETDLYVSLSGRTSPKDWDIAAPEAVLLAAGGAFTQAFFSIGTGIGCILAYSAYLSRRAHLPREAVAVVGMDTAVGLLAGMVTFPVVMSFGLQDVISGSTLGTIFIALPTGLGSLGATGQLVAVLFFALALIAAITSAVSLLEVPVACLIDRLGWSRSRAVWLSTALIFVAGLPAENLHGGSRLDGLRVWGPDADPGGLAPGPVAGLGAPRPFSEGAQSFGESDLAAALSAGDAALDFAAGDHRWSGDQRD